MPKSSGVSPNSPLISVIIPVYQGEDVVLRAVRSALNQTYPHVEVLMVDDGSTDGTLQQLSSVTDPRVRVLAQSNQGVAVARNLGVAESAGDYIAFLDADDMWFPDKLAVDMATVVQSGNPICMIYSGYYAVDEDERLVNLSAIPTASGILGAALFEHEGLLLPSTTLMHRQVFEAIGGFPGIRHHEDRVFFFRACQQFPAYPTGQRLIVYRQSMSGKCRSVLNDFDKAVAAQYALVETLTPMLTPQDAQRLKGLQLRNLFYRFLMYNFPASAKTLASEIDPQLIQGGKKGVLAMLSLKSGINLLYSVRIGVQFFTRYALLPWWRWKSKPVYQAIT